MKSTEGSFGEPREPFGGWIPTPCPACGVHFIRDREDNGRIKHGGFQNRCKGYPRPEQAAADVTRQEQAITWGPRRVWEEVE